MIMIVFFKTLINARLHHPEKVPFSPGPYPPPPPNFGPFHTFPPHHDTSVPPPNAYGHALGGGQAPGSPAQSYQSHPRKGGNYGGGNRNKGSGFPGGNGRGSNSGTPSSSPTTTNHIVGLSGMNGIATQR